VHFGRGYDESAEGEAEPLAANNKAELQ